MHAESLEKARLNEAVVTFVGVVEIVWVEMKRGWMMGEQRYWSPTGQVTRERGRAPVHWRKHEHPWPCLIEVLAHEQCLGPVRGRGGYGQSCSWVERPGRLTVDGWIEEALQFYSGRDVAVHPLYRL